MDRPVREKKPTNHYDPAKEAAMPQWGGTTTKYEAYNFGNAPTTTFPVFTGKHTLFIDDSDDDDDDNDDDDKDEEDEVKDYISLPVKGKFEYDGISRTASFIPLLPWKYGASYLVRITCPPFSPREVGRSRPRFLAEYTFPFTTEERARISIKLTGDVDMLLQGFDAAQEGSLAALTAKCFEAGPGASSGTSGSPGTPRWSTNPSPSLIFSLQLQGRSISISSDAAVADLKDGDELVVEIRHRPAKRAKT